MIYQKTITSRYRIIKKLFLFGLFIPTLFLTTCKNGKTIFGKCKQVQKYARLRFVIFTPERESYFGVHSELSWENFWVYDEQGNPPSEWGNPWNMEERKKLYFISDELGLDYSNTWNPYGKDEVKTYYFKYDIDVDTMHIEYKIKNECGHTEYLRVFYNNERLSILPYDKDIIDGASTIIYKK